MRILLVDDDQDILNSLGRYIGSLGYECVTASSAPMALATLGLQEIDCVITDLAMPGKSGIDLINELREADEIGQRPRLTPVIVMTGMVVRDAARERDELGVAAYMIKPLDFEQLRCELESIARDCA